MKWWKGLALLLALCYTPLALEPVPGPSPWPQACLAAAVYHEARGEPVVGQRAVLDVIQARSEASGKGLCEVVAAPHQFSWYTPSRIILDGPGEPLMARALATPKVLTNETFFFNSRLHPPWAAGMQCRRLGHHTFCKERLKPAHHVRSKAPRHLRVPLGRSERAVPQGR